MKSINTLVADVRNLIDKGKVLDNDFVHLQQLLTRKLDPGERVRKVELFLSNIGSPCLRQLWYRINQPDDEEPLPPEARLKFLYGDILEELLLYLAQEAGHEVTAQQERVVINGVRGRMDCIIDGMVVDVKSASSFAFRKFMKGLSYETDSFGYLDQLGSYLAGYQNDDRVIYKDQAAFFVINKETGKLCLDRHNYPGDTLGQYEQKIDRVRHVVQQENPPNRAFDDVADGKSGNKKLGVNCSYCAFKKSCWPELRSFAYSGKVVHLTKVLREPNVPEIK